MHHKASKVDESIDDRLESQRQEPCLEPQLPAVGSPDWIPALEQANQTTEKDSPDRCFGALDRPKNEDESLSLAGPPLEIENVLDIEAIIDSEQDLP